MSIACKNDNAWISTQPMTCFICSVCGEIKVSHRKADREEMDFIRAHAIEKHGGLWR